MTYRPIGVLNWWCIGLSIVAYVLIFVMTALNVAGYLAVPDWTTSDDLPAEPLGVALFFGMIIVGLGGMLVGLAAGIVFLVWFSMANANVTALGVIGKKTGPGWAVGWWFIPIANFVMPFLALKETYVGSRPGISEIDRAADPTPAIVGWWWAAFLVSGLLTNLEGPLASVPDPTALAAAVWVGVASTALMGVGLWLYVRWSLDICRMQQAKHEAGGGGLYVCPTCDYDLRGTPGAICPECGARLPDSLLAARERARAAAAGSSASAEPWE
ncbi:MAG: DUF4328 domain-containing protein [Planctomycetota bacterium]